ncbi:hypothetical protein ILUMI_14393 [Ignelater luminosus]|uniref:Uncharacterized protein n=1 Tax=Ignelater luminosus TaxID=2038154 RepID=A0A8K0G4W6_IGNLU|nr:hypothetical protein ILUMI_14393 [Ignelater luminosus]
MNAKHPARRVRRRARSGANQGQQSTQGSPEQGHRGLVLHAVETPLSIAVEMRGRRSFPEAGTGSVFSAKLHFD